MSHLCETHQSAHPFTACVACGDHWLLSFSGTGNATTDRIQAAAGRLGYEPQISPVTERGASDHHSFQEVGIASANFSWHGEATPALLEPPY
ncbi:MAG: hypothetical protein ACRCSN_11005, partial [Dermatophilaceae bacterium]